MKILEPGHIYQLQHQDGTGASVLVFVNREAGHEHEGTQTQEVLRALIDRTQHCDSCLRWDGNDKIIHHLRMALALHESRAIERKVEKGEVKPEAVPTAEDGHFAVSQGPAPHAADRGVLKGIRNYVAGMLEDSPLRQQSLAALDRVVESLEDACTVSAGVPSRSYTRKVARDLGEPKTSDHCRRCGESPDSGRHLMGPGAHQYEDPRSTRDPDRTHVFWPNWMTGQPRELCSICNRSPGHPIHSSSFAMGVRLPSYRCNVPMCGDSGICDECRKRGT